MKDPVAMIIEAYIQVYGLESWNRLNERQRHDIIMALARDTLKALEALDA